VFGSRRRAGDADEIGQLLAGHAGGL
jgi:hypothetical protein